MTKWTVLNKNADGEPVDLRVMLLNSTAVRIAAWGKTHDNWQLVAQIVDHGTPRLLEATTADEAKAEAIRIVADRLNDLLDALEAIEGAGQVRRETVAQVGERRAKIQNACRAVEVIGQHARKLPLPATQHDAIARHVREALDAVAECGDLDLSGAACEACGILLDPDEAYSTEDGDYTGCGKCCDPELPGPCYREQADKYLGDWDDV